MKVSLSLSLVLLVTQASLSSSHSILFFHNIGTKSHLYTMFPIVEHLLERGHEVTGVFYSSAKIQHINYTEYLVPDLQSDFMKNMTKTYMEPGNKAGLFNLRVLSKSLKMWPEFNKLVVDSLTSPSFQQLIHARKYDLVISMGMYGSSIAEILDLPMVIVSPPGPFHTQTKLLGNPVNPSYQPVLGSTMIDPTLFTERLNNVISYISLTALIWGYELFLSYNSISPNATALFSDIIGRRTQLILANSHYITHTPQPFMENLVQVGGIHIRPVKALPSDLQQFLDAATDGAILVSFGSAITPSSMAEEKRQLFVETFRGLGIPVIWKWDTDSADTNMPSNVLVRQWLPQQDILAHPNLKVFVTHGGLLSLMEAIYFQTVIVGIPFANDQVPNLIRAEANNFGVRLDWDNLDLKTFQAAIRKALTDTSMQESIERASIQFKDVETPPVEKAVWWIEYVLRNKGAEFLRPASLKLYWFQYYLLDMILLGVLGLFGFLYLSYRLCTCCCGRRNKRLKQE